MVWVGVGDPTGRLERLAGLLEEACAEAGFKEELRRFQPHLTLGRVKGGRSAGRLRSAVAGCGDADFGDQPAVELIVFGSALTPAGPVYSPMARAALGGGGGGGKN
jgi:2'-5' RNA ligase